MTNQLNEHGRVQVGCQGWNYDDWITPPAASASVFYPRGTRATEMLDTYARAFDTVEVDSTFYAVPSAATVEGWARRTPAAFTFALKLPQIITHQLALRRESAEVLNEFCERVRALREKLAAVLVQLPPQFEATTDNFTALSRFLPLLPRDIRFHFEFRDAAWFEESVVELLQRARAGLALVEGPWVRRERVWRLAEALQSDSAYVRWMGERDITRFDKTLRPQDANLRTWGEIIKRLDARGSTVVAYFSNFYEGHAPASANKLKRLLNHTTLDPRDLESQPSLF
jgi:uncharacterized protein YecE (DUF72 family)